jgi:hypothetical protein
MFELQVQSSDPKIKAERETTCHLVLKRFCFDDPGKKLLCFIDDKDFAPLKLGHSKGNRGGFVPSFYRSILSGIPPLPDYVKQKYDVSHMLGHAFSSLIYIHGSTCEPPESLVITFAHELQHFSQFAQDTRLHEADAILTHLRGYRPDLPSESDAFLISKQIATELRGEAAVREYATAQMEIAEPCDRRRWEYFLALRVDDRLTFVDKVRQQCQDNQAALNAMIAADMTRYERNASGFDFDKPDWWNE